MRDFLDYLPPRLDEYDRHGACATASFKARTEGVGDYTTRRGDRVGRHRPGPARLRLRLGFPQEAALLAATSSSSSTSRPATRGDCYDRAAVRVEEMRQSLRIIRQCLDNMPAGPVQVATIRWPRRRSRSARMHDIETLIHHFLSVSWGPVIPPGEALRARSRRPRATTATTWSATAAPCPTARGSARPSFPHMQMLPAASCRGLMVPDLIAILGSMDFVLADVDR